MSSISSAMKALRKRKSILIVALSAAGLALIFVVVRARDRKSMTPPPAPLEVDVVQVRESNVAIYSEWIGTTDGMVNADIRSQVSGYLLRRNYTEGAFQCRVEPGANQTRRTAVDGPALPGPGWRLAVSISWERFIVKQKLLTVYSRLRRG